MYGQNFFISKTLEGPTISRWTTRARRRKCRRSGCARADRWCFSLWWQIDRWFLIEMIFLSIYHIIYLSVYLPMSMHIPFHWMTWWVFLPIFPMTWCQPPGGHLPFWTEPSPCQVTAMFLTKLRDVTEKWTSNKARSEVLVVPMEPLERNQSHFPSEMCNFPSFLVFWV